MIPQLSPFAQIAVIVAVVAAAQVALGMIAGRRLRLAQDSIARTGDALPFESPRSGSA